MTTKTIARAKVAAPAAKLTASPKATPAPRITDEMRKHAAAAPVKGAARIAAAMRLAPRAFAESRSRDETVADIRATFGLKPGATFADDKTIPADALRFVRQELEVGRAASRCPANLLPRKGMDDAARIEFMREQRCFYAAPVEEGKTAGKLGKGIVGRRPPQVHQLLRTAAAWATLVLADAGLTAAAGQKAKNEKQADKAKRAAHHNKPQDDAKSSAKLESAKPENAASMAAHVALQLRTLEAFCKKNAAVCPATVASAIAAALRIVDAESKLQDKIVADRLTK